LAARAAALIAVATLLLSACAAVPTDSAPARPPARPAAVDAKQPETAASSSRAISPTTPPGVVQPGPPQGAKPDATVVFAAETDRAEPESETALQELARRFSQLPHAWILLVAYTDTVGSREYNVARAQRRGNQVEGRLVALGVPAKRIRTVSYGEEGRPQAARRVVEAYLQQHREP
jgi:peptidoglycan-associated lipoprotein